MSRANETLGVGSLFFGEETSDSGFFFIKTTPPFALWLIWLMAQPASMVQRRNSY
jgi:hypothetical protein